MSRIRSVTVLSLLLAAMLVLPSRAAGAADPLQPGDYVRTSVGSCTLSFVYEGLGTNAGKVYIGTAAHCVERVGETVRDDAGASFGRVAMIGDEDETASDYAFIEVFASAVPRVSPAMKGHPQYPRGVATASATALGDQVQFSGYGIGFDLTAPTREQRRGVVVGDDAREYMLVGLDVWGDSGGPIVHLPTGGAYGIVSRLCVGPCTSEGPTVQGLLADASARGFGVSLRSV